MIGRFEKKLRMLVLGSRWLPEPFLERLFRGLADDRLEIWMALKDPVEPDADHIHCLPLPGRNGIAETWHRWRGRSSTLSLRPFLHQSWDLLYFPWNSSAVQLLPLMRIGIPSIVSCRGSQILIAPHVPGREALTDRFPEMFEFATAVHCVSRDILNASMELGLDPAKARVITPAVDVDRLRPVQAGRRSLDEPMGIVGVGSLIWRKGFEDALVAMGLLRDRGVDFRYHIVGDGPDRQRLLFTIRDLDLGDRVVLHGALAADRVESVLHQADVFLLSSVCEGISNAVLEAMACGLPVVSTLCGGLDEAIDHGVEGRLVPTRDPSAMAGALGQMAEDPEGRRKMGQAGRRRVERDFRLQDQVEAFRRLCFETAEKY